MSSILIGNNWDELLKDEFEKPYFNKLIDFVNDAYNKALIYPNKENLFNALKYTPYQDVKVVILGQDPYYHANQAHGLCFSVSKEVQIPKSLRNIFLEQVNDLGIDYPIHGHLMSWAKQGVLLLNTIMTVEDNKPLSHRNKGWETFTDTLIHLINIKDTPVVFLLWGNDAKKKSAMITNTIHLVLTAAHPSPLSAHRGFFGCRHFSLTNQFLINHNLKPIDWQIR